jgi:hypothetical protein
MVSLRAKKSLTALMLLSSATGAATGAASKSVAKADVFYMEISNLSETSSYPR